MKRLDILVWDNQLTSKLSHSFSSFSYKDISIDSYSRDYLKFLPKSLLITVFGFHRLRHFLFPTKYHDINYPLAWSLKSLLFASKLFVKLVFDLCPILYFNPRLLITFTDNAKRFHLIDCIMHPYIPVLTVQNGSQHYLYESECRIDYSNFFHPPSFHSCFCCLSSMDADLHRSYGWTILESYVIGSISANVSVKSLSSSIEVHKEPYIFVVLNSNLDRYASKQLARYVVAYSRSRSIPLVVGIKIRQKSPRFSQYFKKARNLYGENATYNFNRDRSDNFNMALNASIVIGCHSTLLREVFSLGVKIYPLNFGTQKLNCHFEALGLPISPSIDEFFDSLDLLLMEPEDRYMDKFSPIAHRIGVYPFPCVPISRLSDLISRKLNSSSIEINA